MYQNTEYYKRFYLLTIKDINSIFKKLMKLKWLNKISYIAIIVIKQKLNTIIKLTYYLQIVVIINKYKNN